VSRYHEIEREWSPRRGIDLFLYLAPPLCSPDSVRDVIHQAPANLVTEAPQALQELEPLG
jgi:hypothetical protein